MLSVKDPPAPGRPRKRPRLSPFYRQMLFYALFMVPVCAGLLEVWHSPDHTQAIVEQQHQFGLYAFRFLLCCLLVSPLRRFARVDIMVYRRPLGLLAFTYACVHAVLYLVWITHLDTERLRHDFMTHPLFVFGALAFLLLSVLAATSTRGAIRHMGRRWARLHRLVYVAAVLVSVHFCLAFRTWHIEAFVYAALTVVVLAVRWLPPKRRER
ncbi:ferric reductase-like transmembrane domain-containing protein [Acetobacter suratthaniensis]|uniref:Ferric reductase-like transmembrane domain-containing protein n=2 Tax=Acetobacter suratthaniensis TaxID=1502841 RepID=A0ABS3LJA5_9PROT|nr:ferric reductase-like transmembrane domain-containing protein [Acetobacter suratthaniensis]MBO1327678.1 ferric reductase-like transmembrane domain-containing protein [Acetobacter suratthaniensis]MCX2565660.1 ferric reductase-like transmembrane domain-containing protein [Acetobacter suratthaniensis]